MRSNNQLGQVRAICITLAAISFVVFGQTLTHQFVNYDDNSYVYENPIVSRGLTLRGLAMAATYGGIGHWHPVTWLTHMADCQLYGLHPGGHHLTNVLLHTAAAILLFLALREMTGALWRSAFVAAVFAVHPLRVESVAWIAERKDVLSGFFFMLTLWAYARYARRPSLRRYAVMVAAFVLGLLSKDMLVTTPFVLLLLDWWPMQRTGPGKYWGLVKEKIPLFVLSVGACAMTLLVPEKVDVIQRVPLLERLGNAVLTYAIYLRQMFFPTGLSIPYLYPAGGLPHWEIALAAVLLTAIFITAWVCRKKRPYLLMGWLWYLGMLVPAIGIVQISYYARADRYTYLPSIGIALAVTWLAAEVCQRLKFRREVLGGLMAAAVVALMTCAWIQTGYWKDSETLWRHTLACDPDNYAAHNNLGTILGEKGQNDAAIGQYRAALKTNPDYVVALSNLGGALVRKGDMDGAIVECRKALQINSNFANAHNVLGRILCQKGQVDEGIAHFQKAVQLNPLYYEACNNLGNAFMMKGKWDEAVSYYRQALAINPGYAQARQNLEKAMLQR